MPQECKHDKSDYKKNGNGFAVIPWQGRAVLLVDLDAFFASVEQLDHPGWRGLPVIVGGDGDKHGVVSTASYEARTFGVKSAMPSVVAQRLCPDAVWTRGNFNRYREVSQKVMEILQSESPCVQQVSIDEAFLDVSPTQINIEHPIEVARRIMKRIEALGITCSVGLGTSKTVAKIASDMDKPRGLTVVYPGCELDFLRPLSVRVLSGVGVASEEKLRTHGIETLGQLAEAGEAMLVRLFGKNGKTMAIRARGLDDSPVSQNDEVKSVSHEVTFDQSMTAQEDIHAALSLLGSKVGRRLRMKNLKGHTLSLRVRYEDRSVRSVQCQLANPSDSEFDYVPILFDLIKEVWRPGISLKLIGVGVSGFTHGGGVQETLFDFEDSLILEHEALSRVPGREKRQRLLCATDKIKNRYGDDSLRFGYEVRHENNTTGTASKNGADYK